MREELERYISVLEADLEVEVDLHGSRTKRANTLRSLIISAEQDLEGLKTGKKPCDECGVLTPEETLVVMEEAYCPKCWELMEAEIATVNKAWEEASRELGLKS